MAGDFSHHGSSYGFAEKGSFSGYGVYKEDAEDREYIARTYYSKDREYTARTYYSEEHGIYKIHFTIFWNTQVHNKVRIALSI